MYQRNAEKRAKIVKIYGNILEIKVNLISIRLVNKSTDMARKRNKTIKDLTDRELQEDIHILLRRISNSTRNAAIVLSSILALILIVLVLGLLGDILDLISTVE